MGGLGGGSESTSYGYLPYVSPQDSAVIGQYQANAADEAARIAKQQLTSAMATVTSNFVDARAMLNPYSQQGVQATDKLNQYLGLDAYNPGDKAPTAPGEFKPYSPKQSEIDAYIKQNSSVMPLGREGPGGHQYTVYNGVGAAYDGWSRNYAGGPATGLDVIGFNGAGGVNAAQNAQIVQYLKDQNADIDVSNKELYDAKVKQYDQDLLNYNQNLAWYNQYTAEGPKTAEQISNEIVNQPGYKAQFDEGINAVQTAASARGLLGSGNMLKDLTNFANQLSGQYYNTMLDRLANQAAVGANAAAAQSQSFEQQGGALATLKGQLSDTLGNAALAKGNALAQAYQLGHTQYKQVTTGESSSSGGGLSGIGSILGGLSGFMKSSKTYKTKGKKINLNLGALSELPVEKWKYKKKTKIDPSGQEHIGPYAEDFKKVFGVGDGKSIPVLSSIGILYGLVKELNQKIEKGGK